MVLALRNFCSLQTSATRASSPSSRSAKIWDCFRSDRSIGMGEAMAGSQERQGLRRRTLAAADIVSLARLPLAVVFVAADRTLVRLPVLAVAAASDLLDGWLARRLGPSRIGAVLDPITDKIFMVAAFVMVALSRALTPLEITGVLLRDILAPLVYL